MSSLTFFLRVGAEASWKEEVLTTDTSGHAGRATGAIEDVCVSGLKFGVAVWQMHCRGKGRKDKFSVKMFGAEGGQCSGGHAHHVQNESHHSAS